MAKSKDYRELAQAAIGALGSSYAVEPGTRYVYASAVLTARGNVYTASNYGSSTASLTLHAEQAALSPRGIPQGHQDSRDSLRQQRGLFRKGLLPPMQHMQAADMGELAEKRDRHRSDNGQPQRASI